MTQRLLIKYVWEDDEDVLITSTWDGAHMCGSFYPFKKAIDIEYPPSWNSNSKREELKELLGKNYDVVYHKTHIHIEFHPKKEG